jgi:hypothetical protein
VKGERNVSPSESYNPSEFVDRLVLQKLGKSDYTAAEYKSALDQVALEYPDAVEQMRPGWPDAGGRTGEMLAERAEQILSDRGIHEPSAQQYADALAMAEAEAA